MASACRIQRSFFAFLLAFLCLARLSHARTTLFGTSDTPKIRNAGNIGANFEIFPQEEILLRDEDWVEHGRMLVHNTMDYSTGSNRDHEQGYHKSGDGGKKPHGSDP